MRIEDALREEKTMDKREITRLMLHGKDWVVPGQEFMGRAVKKISFRKETHKTTGSSGCPCYVVTFEEDKAQVVIPQASALFVLTEETQPAAAEDGAEVPDLPED